MEDPRLDDDRRHLERAIAGALRSAIHDHGPITAKWVGSAVKRIVGQLRNVRASDVQNSPKVDRTRDGPGAHDGEVRQFGVGGEPSQG